MKMKSKAELSRMKRSKAYREYLRGSHGDLNAIDFNKKHKGDDWAADLYGNNSGQFLNVDASDDELRRIGYDYEEGENS